MTQSEPSLPHCWDDTGNIRHCSHCKTQPCWLHGGRYASREPHAERILVHLLCMVGEGGEHDLYDLYGCLGQQVP